MNRDHMNYEEREAMHILDLAAAGVDVPASAIQWALITTGDAIGLK